MKFLLIICAAVAAVLLTRELLRRQTKPTAVEEDAAACPISDDGLPAEALEVEPVLVEKSITFVFSQEIIP